MKGDDSIPVFNVWLWLAAIDVVQSYPGGQLVSQFLNGTEIIDTTKE